MKTPNRNVNHISIEHGMEQLLHYNSAMRIPIGEEYIDKELFETYFSTEDEEDRRKMEKIMVAAAVKYCYANPDILRKKTNATIMANNLVDAARAARITVEYCDGKYGQGLEGEKEYSKRLKEHSVVKAATLMEQTKRSLKKAITKTPVKIASRAITGAIITQLATHGAATAVGFTVAGVTVAPVAIGSAVAVGLGTVCDYVWSRVPEEKRQQVKKKAKRMAEKVVNVVRDAARPLTRIPAIKNVVDVVETHVIPAVKSGWEKTKEKGRSLWTRAKSLFAW